MFLLIILVGVIVGIGVGIVVKVGCVLGGDDVLVLVIFKIIFLNIG